MKRTQWMFGLLVVLVTSAFAQAAVTSTFAVNNEGFFGDPGSTSNQQTAGADGQLGWVQVTNTASFHQLRTETTPGFTGDWAAQHGEGLSQVVLSFDVRATGAAAGTYGGPQLRIFRISPSLTMWLKSLPASLPANTWVHFEETIDTNWTDAEALANGWTLNSGGSFATIFENVGNFTISSLGTMTTGQVVGYDNIAINAIPEPASLALLGLGGLMMLRRKRA